MTRSEEEVLAEAASLVLLEFASQTPVRVVRAVVYEGRYDQVRAQLGRSLPVGTREIGTDGKGTVTIYQGAYRVTSETTGCLLTGEGEEALLPLASLREQLDEMRDELAASLERETSLLRRTTQLEVKLRKQKILRHLDKTTPGPMSHSPAGDQVAQQMEALVREKERQRGTRTEEP